MVRNSIVVDTFGWALAGALAAAAATLVFQIALGVNNDDTYSLRVIERMARRSGKQVRTDKPGIVFVEIDGLAYPVLQRALRDGHAPEMARWLAAGTHQLVEWETDLSSQTGASQAGILLGSNDDIPAFRWVEKETGTLMTCSAPGDCKEIERRHTNGSGLLVDGGTSRGNLLSGGAEEVILTVSRIKAERRANPGYRAFLSNGHNVTRAVALFVGEVVLELWAAARQRRRDVQPRGHRGGTYPFLRAAMCVFLRDLIVFSVISDMLRGRPAVYATLSGYDEVAHHSGLERHDTLETLRKLDKQLGTNRDVPAGTLRARTRSSSSPITGRRRARRSSSATGTPSTTSFAVRSRRGRCSRFSGATRTRRRWASRSTRRATQVPRRRRRRQEELWTTRRSSCSDRATSASST